MPAGPLGAITFFESLQYLLGFLLVLVVLGVLWGFCAILGWWFTNHAPPKPEPIAPPRPQAESAAAMSDPVEDERITAVVSAAVYCCLGSPARVVSIRPSGEQAAWSREGRRSIFQSHRIR